MRFSRQHKQNTVNGRFYPSKGSFLWYKIQFFHIMYEILYTSLLKLTFYRDCEFVCKRSDILKVSRSLVSTDVMYLKIMIKTVQLVKFQSQPTKYEKNILNTRNVLVTRNPISQLVIGTVMKQRLWSKCKIEQRRNVHQKVEVIWAHDVIIKEYTGILVHIFI